MFATVLSCTSQDDDEMDYYNEETKDDSNDFVGYVFHEWKTTMEEGREFQLPTTMRDEEFKRLGILVLEVDRKARPPLPRYATNIMPPGLTKDEALERAVQNSPPHPPLPSPPFNPWIVPPAPPQPPAYISPAANCCGQYQNSS
jgi:hypothetical protein